MHKQCAFGLILGPFTSAFKVKMALRMVETCQVNYIWNISQTLHNKLSYIEALDGF
jgi:hypothetical protein